MKSKYTIESRPSAFVRRGERLIVRTFKSREAMHDFLNTGNNALRWRESNQGLSIGTYAYAGGQWHNVRNLDASVLAHI